MDIIDIMLAKALTPQGQTETYVSIANAAAAKAAKAEEDAAAAIATVNAAASDIQDKKDAADALLETAQDTIEALEAAQANAIDLEDVDDEIKQMEFDSSIVNNTNDKTVKLSITYPDDTLHEENLIKMYKATGNNEDGTMTQKAIKAALDTKADTSALNAKADKTYVDQKVASISSGGGGSSATFNFATDDAGHIIVIDENGNAVASNVTEEELIEALLSSGHYTAKSAIGIDLDYANKIFTRIQGAENLSMGEDFNRFLMYGGRIKCNVADNGTINAFYGQSGYTEDGSNGQVMIYQPKFYYKRTPYTLDNAIRGKIIRHESLILSSEYQPGFKIAPIFAEDLEYVLLPAYDGSLVDNKLASIANVLPASNMTIEQAEAYATARGTGWHITNMAAESTNQMLEIVEFGMMNGQTALGQGIVQNPSNTNNCYFITGSTASLGNGSGMATSTDVSINGSVSSKTVEGYRAIAYRGMENPWGNFWQMIGGINIYGNGTQSGGSPYICTDFNYTPNTIGNNYEEIGFYLPMQYKWISAMGLGNEKYDWVFLPIECSNNANSFLPIGDSIWSIPGLNTTDILASGGSYGFGDECGPFYYAADRTANESARQNYGAKLMFIPTKNAIYEANISKWNTYIGG